MRTAPARASIALLAFALIAGSCGESEPSRADVVGSITTEVVPVRFAAAADLATGIDEALDEWCAGGPPTAASAAVAATRTAWVELRPFTFGPASDRRSMFIIDPRPRPDDIDALADGDQPVDATSLRDVAGADQRGLGAIEHLLTTDATERRCEYARGVSDLVAEEFAAIADAWSAYGPTLAVDDAAANTALRNIVSESLFAADMAVAEPDSPLSDARLSGVRLALLGDATPTDSDDVDRGIAPLLSDAVIDRLTSALDSDDAMAVQIAISTDVAGELGTTINFSDADGDG